MYAIACVDSNFAIGYQGDLIVHSKKDMRRFVDTTTNNQIIVGRKTFESMNLRDPKDRRFHVVTSATGSDASLLRDICPGTTIYHNPGEVIDWFSDHNYIYNELPVVVIGGESIYRAFMPYVDTVLLTVAHYESPVADAYFPADILNINEWSKITVDRWSEDAMISGGKKLEIQFEFRIYQRRRPLMDYSEA